MADDRTLAEIKEDSDNNFEEILKNSVYQAFQTEAQAHQYRQHCTEKAFCDLGFSPQDLIMASGSMGAASELIDQAMLSRNIRVEDWAEHNDNNLKGLVIYKDNEVAFFISLMHQKGMNYMVRTNVKFN